MQLSSCCGQKGVLRRNLCGLCFIIIFYCKLQIPKSLRKWLGTYCSKYRYFNISIILLSNSSSMLIHLYSRDCGQSLMPQVGLRNGTTVILQEVYTGSGCALEYWVAYCGKRNSREGIRTALSAHANVHPCFSDPTSEVPQQEEALANVP